MEEIFINLFLKDKEKVLNIINSLKLGRNRIKELINFLEEISLKENITIEKILSDNNFLLILNKDNLNRNQKIKHLWNYLKKRRFPLLTQAELIFKKKKKLLKLLPQIILIPPKYFEKEEYEIKFKFKNEEELKKIAENLLNISSNKTLKEILEIEDAIIYSRENLY